MNEHDPLCFIEPNPLARECRTCDLIVKVRADEREKFIAVERFMTERGEASIPKHIVEFIRADEREKAVQRVGEMHGQRRIRSIARVIAAVRGEYVR